MDGISILELYKIRGKLFHNHLFIKAKVDVIAIPEQPIVKVINILILEKIFHCKKIELITNRK
jgi:hypothetical protein